MTGESSYLSRIVESELDRLAEALPAVALEGAKGVGKTATALRRAATAFALDDPAVRSVVAADPDVLLNAQPPVLIDEWQLLPETWDRVRRAVDAGSAPGRFLLTGSSGPAGAGAHSGAGRIVSLRLRPLTLAERLQPTESVSLAELATGRRPPIRGTTPVKLSDYVREIVGSGLPGIRGFEGIALRAQLDGYIARVVDRDLPELGRAVRNPSALRRWMAAYAAATATTTSFEKIRAAAVGSSEPAPARSSVIPYRDALERLFILDPVHGWTSTRNPIKRVGLPPKHHLADPALAARLLRAGADDLLAGREPGPVISRTDTLLGALFESLVTQSVRVYAQANEVTVGHLRTHSGDREVDLIVEPEGGGVVALEVKLGRDPGDDAGRHLRWLADQIGDELLDAIIVTSGERAYRRRDGIAVIPAALLAP